MSGSREKLRAVFLAFVMVTSVMVGTVALTGTAAAAASGLGSSDVKMQDGTLSDQNNFVQVDAVVPGETVEVGPVSVGSTGSDAVFAYDVDADDNIQESEVIAVVEDGGPNDEDGSEDGSVTAQIDFTSAPDISIGTDTGGSEEQLAVLEDTNGNGQLDTGSLTTSLPASDTAEASTSIELADVVAVAEDGEADSNEQNGAGALSSLTISANDRIVISEDHDPDSSGTQVYNPLDVSSSATFTGTDASGQPVIDSTSNDDAPIDIDTDAAFNIQNLELDGAASYTLNYGLIEAGELTGSTTLAVSDVTFTINDDSDQNAFGIVMAEEGSLSVDNSAFNAQTTTNEIGGIFFENANGQSVSVKSSTFDQVDFGLQVGGADPLTVGGSSSSEGNVFRDVQDEAVIVVAEDTANAFGTIEGASGGLTGPSQTENINIQFNSFDNVEDGVYFLDEDGEGTSVDIDTADSGDIVSVTENDFSNVEDFAIGTGDSGAFDGSGDVAGDEETKIEASNNFYGASSGPSDQGPGTGAAVDEEIAFRPFFTDQVGGDLSSVNGLIESSQGQAQNSQLVITFSEPVYDSDGGSTESDGDGADLDPDDFSFTDTSNGGVSISSVSHDPTNSPGTATVTLTGAATSRDSISVTATTGTEGGAGGEDGVFNAGGEAVSTQSVSAAAAVGPSDGDVRVSIGGQASQSLRAGSSAQALDLLRVTDVSGTASLASDTVLSMPDGVTINESETSLSASTTGGLTANANVSDENTITIDHGDTASSTDETMRVSGIVVDVAPDVSASEGGTANDITVNYAIGSIDAGILSGEKPQLRTTGTEIVSAGGSGQDLADSITQLTVSTSNVDGQIANQTNININANQSNGITFDTDIDPTTLTASTTGNAEVDMSSASITQTELTVPVTSHFDAGDSVTIDVTSGDQLLIDAAGDASDSKLSATVVANASTGTVTAESSDQNVDVNVQKPVVDIGGEDENGKAGNLVIGASAESTSENFLEMANNDNVDLEIRFNTDSPLSSNSDIVIVTNRSDVSFFSGLASGNKNPATAVGSNSDAIDTQFSSTAGSESVNSITVNDNSIVLDITNADQVASGSILQIDDLPMVVDSSVEDEAALNFTAETTPSSGTTVTASSDPDGDFIELDKPDTTFNAGSNATIDVDTDGETGVEVNGGGTNALTIDSDDIDGQVGQGTTVRVELDGDGVTFDGSVNYQTGQADNSITNVQTSGGSPNVVNNDDVTRVNPTALEIDLEDSGTSLGGETLTIDELFVNLTASATDTQLRVTTTTTSDTDVTSTAQEIIEPNTIDPSNVFADANINEDPAADDIGPDADNNNGGDYGGTASGEATDDSTTGDNPTTGETIFSSVYTSSQSDGSTAFGGADVSLEVVDTPDGGSDASLNTTSTSTDSSGVADFEFTAGSSTGTYIVNASTSAGSVNVTYEVTAGQASQVNVTNVDNALVQSGATTTEQEVSALRVRLEDSGGNIVTGTDFSFTVDLSGDAQLSTRNPNGINDNDGGGYDGIATDIDNNGEPADNAYTADADGGFTYQAGQDNTDEGVFFIFITDATTEDVTLTVTPDSANAGVNAISADTGTTTFFDQPTQTDVTLNESTISVDDETTAEAVAQTSSGTTIEVPRLNVGSITSNNTTVATVSNTDGSTNDAGVANATVTAEQNGTASIDATVAGNDGSATITVEEAGTGSPLDGPAGRFDNNGDGDISITELGDAGTAFAQGELTIAELGEIGAEFAS